MTARSQLLTVAQRAYVAERYLADTPPRELVEELKTKFAVDVTAAQLRQSISRSGLAKRRAELDRRTCAIVSSAKVTALAKAKAADPAAHLARWTEKTADATDKAFGMVDTATKPRDLASAVSAASMGIRMFRLLAGIDGPGSGSISPANFNFNFGNCIPLRVSDGLPHNAPVSEAGVSVAARGGSPDTEGSGTQAAASKN